MPRYQHIARQLKTAIEQGELAPGTRLPSSRTWAQELGVSRATVENAYGELVAQGWLERRGQAGTFVSNALRFETAPPIPAVFAGESPEPKPFQMGFTGAGSLSTREVGASNGASVAHADMLRSGIRRRLRRGDFAPGDSRLPAGFA